jgi:hypothetical protein
MFDFDLKRSDWSSLYVDRLKDKLEIHFILMGVDHSRERYTRMQLAAQMANMKEVN